MTFTEHLAELRVRIIHSGIALFVGVLLAYAFFRPIYRIVAGPVEAEGVRWVTLSPLEGFLVRLRISVYAGVVLSLPYILYQVCAFIFPGMKPAERKATRILLVFGALLAISGVSVAYFGTLPLMLPYLMSMNPDNVEGLLGMSYTIDILVRFYFVFAAAFQLPLVILILVYFDLLSPATLKAYRRIAIVIIAVVAAMLTPPDAITMVMMAAPLVLLYEVSLWLSYFIARRREKGKSIL